MRGLRSQGLAALLILVAPAVAAGQQPRGPVARADVTGSIGWLNTNPSNIAVSVYDNWHNGGVSGSGTFGWYWTDHLKTEIEAGRATSGTIYAFQQFQSGNALVFRQFRYDVTTTDLALTQRYQFGRNAFFHPFVGAGADLAWETPQGTAEAGYSYQGNSGLPVVVEPARPMDSRTQLRARWLAETGFKAYVSQRAFFRSDVRLTGASALNTVVVRFGFGVDF